MARYKADSMAEAGKIINRLVGQRNRRYLKYTFENLVQKTPVDTYTAANSWFLTGGAPSTRKPEYKFYGKRQDTPAELLSDRAFDFKFGKYNNWFIVNNQDYIEFLEKGRSDQQPNPWIQPTINMMVRLANSGAF